MILHNESVDMEVFRRYAGLSLPRHVSYPMPTWWQDFDSEHEGALIKDSMGETYPYDFSLYIHVPFCETLCKFCACNRVILRKENAGDQVDLYLNALIKDISRVAKQCDPARILRHVHWGGGSPTYLTVEQVGRVQQAVSESFNVADDAEIAMEVDPRGVDFEKLGGLRKIGFNRVSMGVQDFDAKAQEHVRRIQPYSMVKEVVEACRAHEFDSVNFDLIYGMPYQTPQTIRDTVEKAIELSPDRIAYYHYAQIPDKIATQRGMDYTKLPDSEVKFEMFLIGLELFEAAGYDFIGLDHFGKPDEGLAESLKEGTIQRNFQGMTTGGGLHLLGAGVSSISHLLDVGFLQNVKEIDRYISLVESGDSPVERGRRFTSDDRIRQAVIQELYCTAEVRPELIERRCEIRFADYFKRELEIMKELERDGIVTLRDDGSIYVTRPLGRVLMRNVAAVFDAYLDKEAYRKGEVANFSANA